MISVVNSFRPIPRIYPGAAAQFPVPGNVERGFGICRGSMASAAMSRPSSALDQPWISPLCCVSCVKNMTSHMSLFLGPPLQAGSKNFPFLSMCVEAALFLTGTENYVEAQGKISWAVAVARWQDLQQCSPERHALLFQRTQQYSTNPADVGL